MGNKVNLYKKQPFLFIKDNEMTSPALEPRLQLSSPLFTKYHNTNTSYNWQINPYGWKMTASNCIEGEQITWFSNLRGLWLNSVLYTVLSKATTNGQIRVRIDQFIGWFRSDVHLTPKVCFLKIFKMSFR